MAPITDPEGREPDVLRTVTTFDGQDVLDVGCGTGRTTRSIAASAATVLGVDPDGERIAEAREQATEDEAGRVEFREADIADLDLPSASFDTVVFSRSL